MVSRLFLIVPLALALSACPKKQEAPKEEGRQRDKIRLAEQQREEAYQAERKLKEQAEAGMRAAAEILGGRRPDARHCKVVGELISGAKPKQHRLFHAWGVCLERQGKRTEAISILRQVVKLRPMDRLVWESLALACFRAGEMTCWSEGYRKLGRYRATRVASMASSPEVALYEPAGVKAEAESKQDTLVRKGISEARAGRAGEALKALQASLAEDVNHLPTLINLALVNSQEGYHGKGLGYLDRALRLLKEQSQDTRTSPTLLTLRLSRAVLLHRSAKHHAALKEYQSLLSLKPDHELGLYGLGTMQSLLGKKDKALDTYNTLKKAGAKERAATLFRIIMRDG